MKIPTSELQAYGVLCRTKTGKQYQITQNKVKERFTLWRIEGENAEKVAVSESVYDLYARVPWDK